MSDCKAIQLKLVACDVVLVCFILGIIIYSINAFMYSTKVDSSKLAQVKAGELSLHCLMSGKGMTKITPERVDGYYEGRWYFTNGSATNCILGLLNE